jgi:multiple sugar transport system ATP-binding protein
VGEGNLQGRITHLEHLGEHSYAYLETGLSPAPLVVKLAGSSAAIGDSLRFALPAASLHVFDAADEALPRLAASLAAA